MKIFAKKEILPLSLIILAFVAGSVLYPRLPEKLPTHWNAAGEIDAWSSKNFVVFFFPSLTLIIYLLMVFLPLIDPLRKNYSKFALSYFWIRAILVIFLLSLYFYTLGAALGSKLKIVHFMIFDLSVLFIVLGLLLPKIKRNYFVGIRTPWTIHSEEVWEKTHRFSGKVFLLAGAISLAGLFVARCAFVIFIAVVVAAGLICIVYSYFVFRKTNGFDK